MARSPQLPDRTKAWFGIIVGVLLIALFIGSLFAGRRDTQPKENQKAAPHEQ
ncbi:hypothetical protein [Paenibacillus puerhi]|uniref:hypothetical protein n=1 Tax=Paenibacillus puerhi TaxID=2692622 RepID=UPI001356BD3B|nr:hypothetical protein [Paenibacillus puerhi]